VLVLDQPGELILTRLATGQIGHANLLDHHG
jgi:hypothetical protein